MRRGRRFVLSYFMADDTMSVFEPPVRNSGIVGGARAENIAVAHTGTVHSSTLHVTCYMSHVTCYMLHVTHCTAFHGVTCSLCCVPCAGKFLERRPVYAPGAAAVLVTDQDLFVGARLTVAQRMFELTEADDFTLQCVAPVLLRSCPVRLQAALPWL